MGRVTDYDFAEKYVLFVIAILSIMALLLLPNLLVGGLTEQLLLLVLIIVNATILLVLLKIYEMVEKVVKKK